MRPAWVVLLFFLASAAAQTSVSTTDPAGDATLQGNAIPDGTPPELAGFLDILAANATLAADNLTVSVQVAGTTLLQQGAFLFFFQDVEYWIALRYRDEVFHAVIFPVGDPAFPDPTAPEDTTTGSLYREVPGGSPPWKPLVEGSGRYLADAHTFQASFALAELKASDDFAPGPGEPIAVESAVAHYDSGVSAYHDGGGSLLPVDVEGGDDAAFVPGATLFVPGQINGDLGVSTIRPVRFSNGEATTYHWPISILNRRSEAHDFAVKATADAQTQIRVPGAISVPAGATRVVDLFATVPFAHEHGGQRTITVQVDGGGASASLKVEVRYLAVPQPAGHHDTVYLHSAFANGPVDGSWMDTQLEPEGGQDERMQMFQGVCMMPDGSVNGGPGEAWPLEPPLQIGLAARPGEPAHLSAILDVPIALPPSHLLAALKLYDPLQGSPAFADPLDPADDTTAVLEIPLTTPGRVPIELDIPVPASMQHLAPGSGLNLALVVVVCSDLPMLIDASSFLLVTGQAVAVLAGASVKLPLEEYHDPIPIALDNGPRLSVASTDLRVAPGGQALWRVHVDGNASAYDAELFGASAAQAVLHAQRVKPGEEIPVSVAVPADQKAGDFFEVILSVHAHDDPTAASALRLTATVDAQGVDDGAQVSALGEKRKDSPTLAAPLVLVFMAFVVLLRRR